jgi:hypothetical protein
MQGVLARPRRDGGKGRDHATASLGPATRNPANRQHPPTTER